MPTFSDNESKVNIIALCEFINLSTDNDLRKLDIIYDSDGNEVIL